MRRLRVHQIEASNGPTGTLFLRGDGVWALPAGFADPTTTLGDLIVRGSSGPARLGVGAATGNTLITDSAATNGVRWLPGSVGVILLPPGSTAANVPAGTPVGTLIAVEA